MIFSNYAFLMCGKDSRFSFLSNILRHQSWIFNRLYHVENLKSSKEFSRFSFFPPVPLQKAVPHEKKLLGVNILFLLIASFLELFSKPFLVECEKWVYVSSCHKAQNRSEHRAI